MANKICEHGNQVKLAGNGIYFICHFDWQENGEEWRKGSPCRFARWCKEDQLYYASTDKDGKTCPHFSMLRPNPPTIPETKVSIKNIVVEENLILDEEEKLEIKPRRSYTRKKYE